MAVQRSYYIISYPLKLNSNVLVVSRLAASAANTVNVTDTEKVEGAIHEYNSLNISYEKKKQYGFCNGPSNQLNAQPTEQ